MDDYNSRSQASYYEVLGVPQDASDDDIKKAYKKLARAVHPDKQRGGDQTNVAGSLFTEVTQAFEVLSDPARRRIYDVYGHKGLEAGLEVGAHYKSFQELRQEWEKFQAQQKRERVEVEIKVDARSAVDDIKAWRRPERLPYIRSAQAQSSVHFSAAGGLVGLKVGALAAGESRMMRNGQRILLAEYSIPYELACAMSDRDQAEASGTWGLNSAPFAFGVTRQLTSNDTGTLGVSFSDGVPGLQLSFARQLFDALHGEMSVVMTPGAVEALSLELAKTFERTVLKGTFKVGAVLSLSASVTRKLGDKASLAIKAHVGTDRCDAEAGVHRHWDDLTTTYCGVRHGLVGTTAVVKVKRASHVFEMSTLVTARADDWQTLALLMIAPPTVNLILTRLCVRPLLRYWSNRKAAAARGVQQQQLRELERGALAKQMLMRPLILQGARAEAARSGLVIVKAFFGDVDEALACLHRDRARASNGAALAGTTADGPTVSGDAASDDAATPPAPYLDVTLALQYLVMEGALQLSAERDIGTLLGFADLNPGGSSSLYILYQWRGEMFELRVGGRDGIRLPAEGWAKRITDPSFAAWAASELQSLLSAAP